MEISNVKHKVDLHLLIISVWHHRVTTKAKRDMLRMVSLKSWKLTGINTLASQMLQFKRV